MTSSPPPHWDNRRLKSLARIVNGGTPSSTVPEYWDGNISWLTPDDLGKLNTAYVKSGSRSITQEGYDACSTTLAPAGSIVISTRAPIGHTAILEVNACVNQGCRILVPNGTIQTRYLYHSLTALKHELSTRGKGTTFDELSHGDLGTVPILVPPSDEQAAIVHYLDHADEIINRYIDTKEQLIALLEEQRQAVIHQAVTRGLDPNVPLKPSGVSWLGDMPRHWESPRLRYLGNAIIGLTYDPQNVTDVGEGTLVFRASNIRDGRITYEDCVYVGSRVPSLLITRPGDILICSRSGSRALIGKNAKIDENSAGNTFGAFMTVFRSETNDYLHYVFNSNMFEHQSAMFATSTVNQLTLGMINDMKTPFPPPHEQEMIVGYLDQATAKIDQAIIQTKHQIDLTNEYRTSLIADVVTGQIDVRHAVVELPD